MNLMGIVWSKDDIERMFVYFVLFYTQLTVEQILRLRDISRLSIHPYWFYYTYRDIISMDASFYHILTSEVFFIDMDCQLFCELEKAIIGRIKQDTDFCLWQNL